MSSLPAYVSRILVVDDEPMVCEMIEAVLTYSGHDVVLAGSGTEALNLLASQAFHLVITDYHMPDMNGAEFVTLIKARLPDQRVMMISGITDLLEASGELPRGVDSFLCKPLRIAELRLTVSNLLARDR
jgi:DNA-binding response OmpR family regulator